VGHRESVVRPEWVSDDLFPFESRFFTTPSGQQMHFVDEGSGDPIVFVHGNPSWSFEFRHLVKALRSHARCIAPDHIGFGLSSWSNSSEDHHPQTHARNLEALLDHLELRDITLYMSDWGGPIGLDFTRHHPQRVRRIVISNTWCWPVGGDLHFRSFSFFMSSPLGQYLVRRRNFFVNRLMPMAVGDRSVLTPEVMEHYRNAQADPEKRCASAALPGHIVGARDWLDSIWKEHARFADKPVLILWGCRDRAFRRKELDRWRSAMWDYECREFKRCGHFLAEEAPDEVASVLRAFLRRNQFPRRYLDAAARSARSRGAPPPPSD